MQTTNHKVTHHYQPTNMSCGYTALATLLSFYGIDKDPLDVANAVAPDGHEFGSLTAEVASWCRSLDLAVQFYSFDFQITDFSWIGMSKDKILKRLRAIEDARDVAALGKEMSARYVRAYIDLLEKGADLTIAAHPTSEFLYELLRNGPVYINVCPKVLHETGRMRKVGLRKSVTDDIEGKVGTHSIIIYGNDADGNFLIADPWDGLYAKPSETVICAITAAEIECDSQCFQASSQI